MIKKGGEAMLFDLDKDIAEQKNMYKQSKDQYKNQRAQYEQWNDELQDPAFPRLGSWDFTKQNKTKTKKTK